MIVKISALFLLVIVGLAVWGRMRKVRKLAGKCPRCGRPQIGAGPCPCKTTAGGQR